MTFNIDIKLFITNQQKKKKKIKFTKFQKKKKIKIKDELLFPAAKFIS